MTLQGQLWDVKSVFDPYQRRANLLGLKNYSGLIVEPQLRNLLPTDKRASTVNTLQVQYETTERVESLLKAVRKGDDFAIRAMYRMKEFLRRIQAICQQTLNLYLVLRNHYRKFDQDMPPLKVARDDEFVTELQPEDVERLNEGKVVEELPSLEDEEEQRAKAIRSQRGLTVYQWENKVSARREEKKGNIFRKNTIVKFNGALAMESLLNSIEDPINRVVFKEIYDGVTILDSESLLEADD